MGEKIYFQDLKWGSRGSKDTAITRALHCSSRMWDGEVHGPSWASLISKTGVGLREAAAFLKYLNFAFDMVRYCAEGSEGRNCALFWAYRYFPSSFMSTSYSFFNLSLKPLHSLCVFRSSVVKSCSISHRDEAALSSYISFCLSCLPY